MCTDGGARGNPGPAAIAYGIYDATGDLLEEDARYLGKHTNNEAEYEALLWGLEKVIGRRCKRVRVITDSELVVRQTTGEYRTRDPRMARYSWLVRRSRDRFESFEIQHVGRSNAMVSRVDAMVNRVLDECGYLRR